MTIDRSSWWWRQGRATLVILASLLAAGIILEPLQKAAWTVTRANQPELNFKDLGDNLGQGTLLGVLGGFRNILADFAWLRGYTYWEERDLPNTLAMLGLSTTLDPRVIMFWTDGSREIAYDIPIWFMRAQPVADQAKYLQSPEYKKIHDDLARRALDFLDRGLQFLPDNYYLLLNKAEIYQNRLADSPAGLEAAAEQYRLAAAATHQFYFPMRQSILILWDFGDRKHRLAAYDYLRQQYPTLPEDVPDAQKSVMWDMLQLMEKSLQIPEAERCHFPKPANYSNDPDFEPLPGLGPNGS